MVPDSAEFASGWFALAAAVIGWVCALFSYRIGDELVGAIPMVLEDPALAAFEELQAQGPPARPAGLHGVKPLSLIGCAVSVAGSLLWASVYLTGLVAASIVARVVLASIACGLSVWALGMALSLIRTFRQLLYGQSIFLGTARSDH